MNGTAMITLTTLIFLLTLMLVLWRPRGLNEAIPASIGATIILFIGSVSITDLIDIASKVSGPAITILSTIAMAIVLESFGFFRWAAAGLAARAKGSGIRLFWYINLLCFLMTVFFNNDGSILITTPILLLLLRQLGLKNHQKLPYLISGALIATASSAPIGVSNIVNLISLKIVNLDLYQYTQLMFVPVMLTLLLFSFLIFLCVRHDIPRKIPMLTREHWRMVSSHRAHPLQGNIHDQEQERRQTKTMRNLLLFVLLVRISLFIGSYFGISESIVALLGSIILIGWRWLYLRIIPIDLLKKTPWHIFVFAFSMYVIIYGLNNIGLIPLLMNILKPVIASGLLSASIIMGVFSTILSVIFNNHPALMVGTIAISNMEADPIILQIMYLANVIGSDIGALLLPIGTLASLIWFSILRQNKIKIAWKDYLRVTFLTVPITLLFALVCLYFWVSWLYV